jgi:ElaB/YqjD/DUF883 family membrane-anchored ribosome-binding protein
MHRDVTTEKLLADLQTVVDDAEALLKATSTQTGEKIQSARSRAEQSLRQARARLEQAEGQAIARARRVASDAEGYVHEKPWQAMGVAAGLGIVLGLLLNRR